MAADAAPADLHAAPPAFVADAAVDANERIEPLHGEPTSNSLAEEKQGRRRRRRRGGRGGEGQEGDTGADEAQGQDAAEPLSDAAASDAMAAPAAAVDAEADDQGEGHSQEEGRRRRRRGPRRERGADEAAPVDGAEATVAATEAAPQQLALSEAPADALVPPQAAEPIVVATSEAPAAPAPFVLPLTDLQQLAQGAGLNWVHSDADKVAAAQAAIAAEPKPVRVPRERPPVVQLDEGPLVLVETKKDLSQVKLPFDQ